VIASGGEEICVCLLVYNHAPLLPDTIESILNQTVRGFEFIISDDCSTDDSWKIVNTYAQRYPEIKAIQTPRNLGMCGNANYAVAQTSRPYVALLHHDDLYRSDLLEKWLQVVRRHEDVAFVFNDYYMRESKTPASEAEGRSFSENNNGDYFLERALLSTWSSPVRGTAMIRRSAWQAAGGLKEEFGMLADVDLWMRLAARWNVGYVGEPLIRVRAERPDYYPPEYTIFTWHRMRLLYSIHADNRKSHYTERGLRNWIRWMHFRSRVSLETTKWLGYAVWRKRQDMICQSPQGECPWEFWPVKWVRKLLLTAANALGLTTSYQSQQHL
jgi:glycosyltransferase involved in cell wall biosynthesis